MIPIGVMQGRLTPSRGRGIQFCLADKTEWEQEFELAKSAGVSCIEWVCDPRTPLFNEETQKAVREVVVRTGVRVRNMDLHEITTKTDIATLPDELFEKICSGLKAVDGGAVEVPMVEASSLLDKNNYDARVEALRRLVKISSKYGVSVGVETDLPPQEFEQLLKEVPDVSAVYDCGNSAGLGYEMEKEIAAYGKRISNVHIKDKPIGGATVPLGQGSADFKKLFALLRASGYTDDITLQVARGEDNKEVETIKNYISFIQHAYE